MEQTYENLSIITKDFPIIFHTYQLCKSSCFFPPHWHENIEVLFMTEGITQVALNENNVQVSAGDIVVVNSSVTHKCSPVSDVSEYDCLIVDKNFCEKFGFFVDEKVISHAFSDDRLFELVKDIKMLRHNKPEYYSSEILADTIKILSILFRDYIDDNYYETTSKNLEMVKKGVKYINKHLKNNITIDEICDYTGYSKYHFCRCFRDITGYTVNSYINRAKIEQAYRALSSGEVSVGDIADEYGFNDMSYFTKVFKKYTNILPSKVKAEIK